ncbi:MAG: (2Fe-2S) ferredoxin domain-containing protein [Clostridia bacterium]|nr:(2Fe-2S) ferredoxin domain-containing protein [Clostridia bacterium]
MIIEVCIDNSCEQKGAFEVVKKIQELIAANSLTQKIVLQGCCCKGKCGSGVSVTVDQTCFSVLPGEVTQFFKEQVLKKL